MMTKKIAIYGNFIAKVPVRQRYWIKRKDGIKQRYWKTTKRMKKAVLSGRYEFYGTGRDLYKAMVLAHRYMPKGFVDVSVEMFLSNPMKYGFEGKWLDREVVSG